MSGKVKRAKQRMAEARKSRRLILAGARAGRIVHSEVRTLPPELQQLAEQMLTEGASFEDVAAALEERGGEGVTLRALEDFVRSNAELHRQRIRLQLDFATRLKNDLDGSNPVAAEILDSLILTGLVAMSRQRNHELARAIEERTERENLQLRQQKLRLQAQKQSEQNSGGEARQAKADMVLLNLKKALNLLDSVKKETKLDNETYQKIREIYGLVRAPLAVDSEREKSAEG